MYGRVRERDGCICMWVCVYCVVCALVMFVCVCVFQIVLTFFLECVEEFVFLCRKKTVYVLVQAVRCFLMLPENFATEFGVIPRSLRDMVEDFLLRTDSYEPSC